MALTKDQAAEKVIARLIEKGEKADGLLKPDILSWMDEALQRLARRIADSPDFTGLQKEANITVTNGIASVDSTLLLDTIQKTGLVIVFSDVALSGLVIAGPGVDLTAPLGTFLPTDVGLTLTLPTQPQGGGCSTTPHTSTIVSVINSGSITVSAAWCVTGTYAGSIARPSVAKWKPRYDSLLQSNLATDIAHYTVRGDRLYFKDLTGSLSFNSTGTVLANFVPTLGTATSSDLPVRFENQLIDTLIEMAYEKQNRKPAPIISSGE
jgi:hypothetical protein